MTAQNSAQKTFASWYREQERGSAQEDASQGTLNSSLDQIQNADNSFHVKREQVSPPINRKKTENGIREMENTAAGNELYKAQSKHRDCLSNSEESGDHVNRAGSSAIKNETFDENARYSIQTGISQVEKGAFGEPPKQEAGQVDEIQFKDEPADTKTGCDEIEPDETIPAGGSSAGQIKDETDEMKTEYEEVPALDKTIPSAEVPTGQIKDEANELKTEGKVRTLDKAVTASESEISKNHTKDENTKRKSESKNVPALDKTVKASEAPNNKINDEAVSVKAEDEVLARDTPIIASKPPRNQIEADNTGVKIKPEELPASNKTVEAGEAPPGKSREETVDVKTVDEVAARDNPITAFEPPTNQVKNENVEVKNESEEASALDKSIKAAEPHTAPLECERESSSSISATRDPVKTENEDERKSSIIVLPAAFHGDQLEQRHEKISINNTGTDTPARESNIELGQIVNLSTAGSHIDAKSELNQHQASIVADDEGSLRNPERLDNQVDDVKVKEKPNISHSGFGNGETEDITKEHAHTKDKLEEQDISMHNATADNELTGYQSGETPRQTEDVGNEHGQHASRSKEDVPESTNCALSDRMEFDRERGDSSQTGDAKSKHGQYKSRPNEDGHESVEFAFTNGMKVNQKKRESSPESDATLAVDSTLLLQEEDSQMAGITDSYERFNNSMRIHYHQADGRSTSKVECQGKSDAQMYEHPCLNRPMPIDQNSSLNGLASIDEGCNLYPENQHPKASNITYVEELQADKGHSQPSDSSFLDELPDKQFDRPFDVVEEEAQHQAASSSFNVDRPIVQSQQEQRYENETNIDAHRPAAEEQTQACNTATRTRHRTAQSKAIPQGTHNQVADMSINKDPPEIKSEPLDCDQPRLPQAKRRKLTSRNNSSKSYAVHDSGVADLLHYKRKSKDTDSSNYAPSSPTTSQETTQVIDLCADAVYKDYVVPGHTFPQFKDGDVYIQITDKHRIFTCQLHSQVLARAAPWFAATLGKSVSEPDDEVAANLTNETGITIRYEMDMKEQTTCLQLRRVCLTTNVPNIPPSGGKRDKPCKGAAKRLPAMCGPTTSRSSSFAATPNSVRRASNRDGASAQFDEEGHLNYDYIMAHDNLFRIYYFKQPSMAAKDIEQAFRQTEALVYVAQLYGSVKLVRPSINDCLCQYGQVLYESIYNDPPRWLHLASTLQCGLIFKEALIHAVGRYSNWPSNSIALEDLPVPVEKLYRAKVAELKAKQKLFRDQISQAQSSLTANQSIRTSMMFLCVRKSREGKFDSRLYRLLREGGDSYLPTSTVLTELRSVNEGRFSLQDEIVAIDDLDVMKRYARSVVEPLLVNRSMLDPGEADFDYLTCTEVRNEELPWEEKSS